MVVATDEPRRQPDAAAGFDHQHRQAEDPNPFLRVRPAGQAGPADAVWYLTRVLESFSNQLLQKHQGALIASLQCFLAKFHRRRLVAVRLGSNPSRLPIRSRSTGPRYGQSGRSRAVAGLQQGATWVSTSLIAGPQRSRVEPREMRGGRMFRHHWRRSTDAGRGSGEKARSKASRPLKTMRARLHAEAMGLPAARAL